jgi:cytochrome c6
MNCDAECVAKGGFMNQLREQRIVRIGFVPIIVFSLLFVFTPRPAAADSPSSEQATALYAKHCKSCHGDDGRGKTKAGEKLDLKDLASAEVQAASDAQMRKLIAEGKGKMPAYAKKMSDEEIDLLVAFVRKFKP